MVAAAVIGAGVVGAVGSAVAGGEAASATKSATNASINAQNAALTKQEQLNAPYAAIGTGTPNADGTTSGGAIAQYQGLLGLGPQGAAGEQATLAATPGYQFAKQQGLDATKNAASASGLALSGNTLEGLDQFSTGLADSTYQSAVGNAQNAVAIGQNAAAGTGAAVSNTANNVSSSLINQGNNIAGIDANTIAGITKSGASAANGLVTMNTLAGLNNPYAYGVNANNYGAEFTPANGAAGYAEGA